MAHKGEILGFGGWNGEDVSGDTWIWGGSWRQVLAPGPRKRGAFAMAHDVHEERVMLFGGLWLDGQYADLWQWESDRWTRLGGPYDNSSGDHHAMVYDVQRRQVVMFGGKNYRYRPLGTTRTIADGRVIELAQGGALRGTASASRTTPGAAGQSSTAARSTSTTRKGDSAICGAGTARPGNWCLGDVEEGNGGPGWRMAMNGRSG